MRLTQFLQDHKGEFSSKRLFVLACAALAVIAAFADMFLNIHIRQFIFEYLMYAAMVGLAVIGAENWKSIGGNSGFEHIDGVPTTSDQMIGRSE